MIYQGDDDFDITKDFWIIAYAGNKRLTERCYASEEAARVVWDQGAEKIVEYLGVEGVDILDLTDYDWNIIDFDHLTGDTWKRASSA